MTENELLGYACEQFLGKSVVEIKSVILQTLEGHLRAILGGYTDAHADTHTETPSRSNHQLYHQI